MDPAGLAVVAAAVTAAGVVVAWERYRRRQEARAWLQSVRSVISGDPDAAIEALSDAARLRSPQAVDTYLALGQLFRREGDLSRALRLHRNMLLGRDLPVARRPEVERELAEDYRRSGMLGEAAEIYRRLAPADPVAAVGLREVLFEGGDLTGAIEVQRGLGGTGPDPILAHLLAARARALGEADPAAAEVAAVEAVAAHPGSADAWLARAELAAGRGDTAAALAAVGTALDQVPRAAPLAWAALGRVADLGATLAFLERRLTDHPEDAALHLLHARALFEAGRKADALAAARRALALDREGEVLHALREALQVPFQGAPEEVAARHALLVEVLARRLPPPTCRRCGAVLAATAFRCGACGTYRAG